MKKIMTIAGILAFCLSANAQDAVQRAAAEAAAALTDAPKAEAKAAKPQYWANSADFGLGFNHTSLRSWAAGGYNTVTLSADVDLQANYNKDLMSWNNRLQLNYGFLWSADKNNLLQKSNDRIYLESKWAYKTGDASSKWNYTASFDFRSQFSNSYDKYVQDLETQKWSGTLKSGLFSPAYTNIALGMEWKPTDWFNVNMAPLTGGLIIVTNPELRKNYGMQPIDGTNDYHSALFQLGAQIKMNAKATINDAITYDTQLVLFTDYLNKPFVYNRVNWDNKLTWQASKLFRVALNTWLIYDPIVSIDGVTSKVQFKEFFSINFTYKITNKK